MKWFAKLFIIFIILFQILPVFAEEESGVKVGLSSAPERLSAPKSLLTSVFTINNFGITEDTYKLEAIVPEGWQVVSSLETITIASKETKMVPVTISVPGNALMDQKYELKLTAVSQKDPNIMDEAVVAISILPYARVKVIGPTGEFKRGPGESAAYSFTIINLGNGRDTFEIIATSAHKEEVSLSKKIVELDVAEKEDIIATIHIPMDVSPGTKHVLTLRVSSITLQEGVHDEVILYTSILGKIKSEEEGLYNKLDSQVITHISGLGTGKQIGAQAEFSTKGYIDDRHWLDFSYQGPYFKDRENYRGLSEEKISMDFGSDLWEVGLGDTTVSISELIQASMSEDGARFSFNKSPISCMVFDFEKKGISFNENLRGGRIAADVIDNTKLGVNFLETEEDKIDLSASRLPEKRRILSFSTSHELEEVLIDTEYAKSAFDEGAGEKDDSAWWVSSKLKKEKLYLTGEYIYAGSDYAGRRKDIDGYRVYSSYRLLEKMWGWIQKNQSRNNLNGDSSKATDDTDRTEIGASLAMKNLPYLSFSYALNKTESEQNSAFLSDSNEDVFTIRSHDSLGDYSLSLDFSWTQKEDVIKSVDSFTSDYTTRIYRRWEKTNGWFGYSYNIEQDDIQNTETVLQRKELGISYRPLPKLSSSMTFSQEGRKGEKEDYILGLDVGYIPWQDSSFTLEGELRNDHQEFINAWQFWATFRTTFDLVVPFVRVRGQVIGTVFIDDNNNGVVDKGEKGVSGITLQLKDKKAVTNKKGRFKLPFLVPGEYELELDISSLPIGLGSYIELPYKVSLAKGKVVEVNIPLGMVGKVKGAVFEDKNKNGKRDESERGLPLIRIVIMRDSSILRDTFSDKEGEYSIAGILPGGYILAIEEKWLPERYKLTTPAIQKIDLKPEEVIAGLDFGAVEKERAIVKTYTAPVAEKVVVVEKKKEAPKSVAYLVFALLMAVFTLILIRYAKRK